MALETATYIDDLVATNPVAGDPVAQGDDHIRLIKSTLQNTFPSVTGAVTPTHTQINQLANNTFTGANFTGKAGYTTGAGGAVTQATSKSTAVTLDKPVGRITMHAASLAAGATVGFNLNNSTITSADYVGVHYRSGGSNGSYTVSVGFITSGVVTIYVKNESAGALAEPVEITFMVFQGATS